MEEKFFLDRLLTPEQMADKIGLYAKVTLPAGISVETHEHHGEGESYFILSGTGVYNDNGTLVPCKAGDRFFCKDGEKHGITADTTGELLFMALIIKK